jgi:acyl carrier protein
MSELATKVREQCYATVLPGVPVGPDDNFFDLGGDSLGLIRLVAIAQDVFDVEIDALDFFLNPTMTALVGSIDTATRQITGA